MDKFHSTFAMRMHKKRKIHKECLNYLDQYKACVIGINQQQLAPRRSLSDREHYEKRQTKV